MNCRTVFSIAALGALTACQSLGGLAEKGPAWIAVYQVPYATMANCLVERERLPWINVTPSTYPQERRATVAVTTPTGSALGGAPLQWRDLSLYRRRRATQGEGYFA